MKTLTWLLHERFFLSRRKNIFLKGVNAKETETHTGVHKTKSNSFPTLSSDCLRLGFFFPMHIRHRCRNGPRLIKEISAFPAEVPTGHLFGCFTSHCLGQGFETCPLINEHPIQARPPSFVPFSLRLYGFIRSRAGWGRERHCKEKRGFLGNESQRELELLLFLRKGSGRSRMVSILLWWYILSGLGSPLFLRQKFHFYMQTVLALTRWRTW